MTATPSIPRRLVSLVPSTTESVLAFGAGDHLVGCTRYCPAPAAVARIGGTKNPARERIAALLPDLVLANAEENRPEDLAWLGERFPLLVQTPRTVGEAGRGLRELAVRLGGLEAALPVLLRLEAQLAAVAVEVLARRRPPLRAFYAIWAKPWMSINRDTFAHDVLERCGAVNVCRELAPRYPEVTPAQVRELGAEVVLLSSEPWAFDTRQQRELEQSGVFGQARVALCDGRDFTWHGVHIADGLGRAAALLAALGGRS